MKGGHFIVKIKKIKKFINKNKDIKMKKKSNAIYLNSFSIPAETYEQLLLLAMNDNNKPNQDGHNSSTPEKVAAEILRFHFEDYEEDNRWKRKEKIYVEVDEDIKNFN
jgi:hypothetical protein